MTPVEEFFSTVDAPVVVVTAEGMGQRSACLVGFATQCSITPPRFLACLSVINHTYGIAAKAESLGVHVLGAQQLKVASLFGEETGDNFDKFSQVIWHYGRLQTPMLEDCAAWLEGQIIQRIPFGDHIGFLLEPVDAGLGTQQGLLVRSKLSAFSPGHPASV